MGELTSFFTALSSNIFLLMGLLAGLAASFAGGIVGSYVVVKRIVFIAGSIAHAIVGGIGLFVYLQRMTGVIWLTPLLGALVTAILSAFLIGWIHLRHRQREDTVIAAIWSSGMSIGVIFIAITPGNTGALMHFLFGNILWATASDVITLLILDAIVIVTAALLHRRFLAICFDEQQAALQGLSVTALYFTLLALIAITTVLLIQVIGAILVISMLCLPAAIANLATERLSKMIYLAILLSLLFTVVGFFLSYSFNWPPGATIALTSTIAYLVTLPVRKRAS